MTRFVLALLFLVLGAALPPEQAAACGDKFLVIGRGARRVQTARHPASILLMLRADTKLASAARDMRLEATLKQAGHTVETVTEPVTLSTWLATHRYDFIVTALEAAPAAARDAAAAESHPAVIPVAVKADAAAVLAAEKTYGLVIQAPTKSLSYLKAFDAAMGLRRTLAAR